LGLSDKDLYKSQLTSWTLCRSKTNLIAGNNYSEAEQQWIGLQIWYLETGCHLSA